jgi:hypothetical protein
MNRSHYLLENFMNEIDSLPLTVKTVSKRSLIFINIIFVLYDIGKKKKKKIYILFCVQMVILLSGYCYQ